MTRASDYFKYYETLGDTAVAADIAVGKIAYIEGGRVIGQGIAPGDSITAFYRTQDANITSDDVTAWKSAHGKNGFIMGTYYPGVVPATGGIIGLDERTSRYNPTGDTFNLTAR